MKAGMKAVTFQKSSSFVGLVQRFKILILLLDGAIFPDPATLGYGQQDIIRPEAPSLCRDGN